MITIGNIHISPLNQVDAWNLCDFVVSNEDRLKTYLPKTLAQNLTPTLSKSFVDLKMIKINAKQEFLYTMKENSSNAIIGLVYIKNLDWEKKQGEFAYCIGYTHEGQGLMSKVIKALSRYAMEEMKLHTLQIITHKTNIGSVKVAENCEFKWKKTLPDEFTPPNGTPLNMELYDLHNER